MYQSLMAKLNKFPPFLCRFVARDKSGQRPLSNQDIAKRSGLNEQAVCKICRLKTWNDLTLDTIERFSSACGVNLLHPRRHLDFLKRRSQIHAKKSLRLYSSFLKP